MKQGIGTYPTATGETLSDRERGTQARLAVEAFLKAAPLDESYSPKAIASGAAMSVQAVRMVISGLIRHLKVANVGDAHDPLYRWVHSGRYVPPSVPRWSGGNAPAEWWRKLQPTCSRPDALRAFQLPSMEGGELRERRVPLIMASSVEVRK